jgi:acyl-CoA synthetase (AMP-forming)/AMP-acid ligase II
LADVRGGAKVYPSEVEGVLAAHEAIAEVAVVGWPDQKLGEEVAAFVVLRRARNRKRSWRTAGPSCIPTSNPAKSSSSMRCRATPMASWSSAS